MFIFLIRFGIRLVIQSPMVLLLLEMRMVLLDTCKVASRQGAFTRCPILVWFLLARSSHSKPLSFCESSLLSIFT